MNNPRHSEAHFVTYCVFLYTEFCLSVKRDSLPREMRRAPIGAVRIILRTAIPKSIIFFL